MGGSVCFLCTKVLLLTTIHPLSNISQSSDSINPEHPAKRRRGAKLGRAALRESTVPVTSAGPLKRVAFIGQQSASSYGINSNLDRQAQCGYKAL